MNPAKRTDRTSERKQYEMGPNQYAGCQTDHTYNGRGMPQKMLPQPQYPHGTGYQNQSDNRSHSHPSKSSSRKGPSSVDVVGSRIIASKQFITSLSDQSNSEGVPEAVPVKPEHVVVGGLGAGPGGVSLADLGARECPSGASSPGGTPNSTLVKPAPTSKPPQQHYDPLTASASMNQLEMGPPGPGGHGGGRGMYPPPQDPLETQSESNLLNYPYRGGGVAVGGHGKAPPPGHRMQPTAPHPVGVKGLAQDWESRGVKAGTRPGGEQGEGPGRVLHPPVSTSAKERRRREPGVTSPPSSHAAGEYVCVY